MAVFCTVNVGFTWLFRCMKDPLLMQCKHLTNNRYSRTNMISIFSIHIVKKIIDKGDLCYAF